MVSNEPIRFAQGGATAHYVDRVAPLFGNAYGFWLVLAAIAIGRIVDILSFGRERIGGMIAGLLSGGLAALISSAIVAWRGDVAVADLFFGSVWNIAWAGTALGVIIGAFSGFRAALLRERQRQRYLSHFTNDRSDQLPTLDKASDAIRAQSSSADS